MKHSAVRRVPDMPPLHRLASAPRKRIFALPPPIRSVGFLARGGRRDVCVDAVLELASLTGQLPSCIDLLEPASQIAAHGPMDLVLLSRSPSEPVSERQRQAGDTVLRAGSPVLLLPPTLTAPRLIGARALIVWDGSLSAISALRAAAPLLRRAKEVMVVDAPGDEPRASVDSAMTFLRALPGRRLLDATRLEIGSKPLVLETAQLTRADYVVMGGFGRWGALSDVIYGDSDSSFARARLPVLLGQ